MDKRSDRIGAGIRVSEEHVGLSLHKIERNQIRHAMVN